MKAKFGQKIKASQIDSKDVYSMQYEVVYECLAWGEPERRWLKNCSWIYSIG